MLKSFRHRLTLGVAAIVLAVTAAAAVWMHQMGADSLRVEVDRLVQDRAFALSRAVGPGSMALAPWMEIFLETDKLGLLVQLRDGEGAVVARSANLTGELPFSAAARNAVGTSIATFTETVPGPDGAPLRLATVPVSHYRDGRNTAAGFAQVALPLAGSEAQLRRLRVGLMVLVAGTGLLAWAWTTLLAGRWLHTLEAARESVARIADGRSLRERLFVPVEDSELARLARTFNDLLDRLQAAHNTQQRFLADASHELRTPLTVLRGEIGVMLRRERKPEEYRETLASCLEEIERLSRLTDNLLALARADAGEAALVRGEVELGALCRDAANSLAPRADAAGITVAVEAPSPVVVDADRMALHRVLVNLLDNALRHCPRGERVDMRVRSEQGAAVIEIADTGPGIGAEHLPNLFERFYRVDPARARVAGGAGLGLAIVKALVEAHGGTVSVASEVGRGTTFRVCLPVAVTGSAAPAD